MCKTEKRCYTEKCSTRICDEHCANRMIHEYMEKVGREEFYKQWEHNALPWEIIMAITRMYAGV